jgi:hypothetical protein
LKAISEEEKLDRKVTLKQQKVDQLSKDRSKMQRHLNMGSDDWKKSKLYQTFNKAKTARVKPRRGAKQDSRSLEENQMQLNYNYGFWRMTQLFGRCLYIKYYRKTELKAEQFIGFDGAIEEAHQPEGPYEEEPDVHFEEMSAPE